MLYFCSRFLATLVVYEQKFGYSRVSGEGEDD